jgi:hypothetical protein
MSKSAQQFILIFLGVFVFVFIVYFIFKAIDALTKPSVVWWGVGFASCLVAEGLIWCIYRILRHTWRFWV